MRIGRLGFALGQCTLFAAAYWHDAVSSRHIFNHIPPGESDAYIALCFFVGSWILAVLRCHDFNQTVWDNFWKEQTPLVGWLWALGELLIKPGTPGGNSYGAQPII